MRFHFGSFAGFAALGTIMLLLGAQQAANRPPATKPAPIVTVTKTDGSLVRGQIVSSDPDQVVLKPSLKAGEKVAGDDVTVPWKEIKIVSSGLTQKKALEAWKDEHAKELCDKCGGDRLMTCPTCKGTGHDPKSSKDCKTCNGAMEVKCKAPKCKEGKTPCPKPCLKLTEGHWVKKADGLQWRIFPKKRDGTWREISEHHLGQLVTKTADGDYVLGDSCATCGGKGEASCPECHGTAKVACATCRTDKAAADCADCDDGKKKCAACDGTGLKKEAGAKEEFPKS
jgi:hypothetical protein